MMRGPRRDAPGLSAFQLGPIEISGSLPPFCKSGRIRRLRGNKSARHWVLYLSTRNRRRSEVQHFCLNDPPIAKTVDRSNSSVTEMTPMDARRHPFDSVTIAFHWATVLIVLAMFATAWLHARSHDAELKAILLQTHRSMGLTIWAMTVSRLVWRLTHAKLPPFASGMTRIHRAIVQISEYGLYALLLIQPMTGLGDTIFRGRGFAIFLWQIPPLIPTDAALRDAFQLAHQIGACTFGALVMGHAAAALFHHFVLRDDVLQCMAPIITAAQPDPEYLSEPSFAANRDGYR
jgi:cytochrome b561